MSLTQAEEAALKSGTAPERVGPRGLRHTFASHLLDRGEELRSLQTPLGHTETATTQIHTQVCEERLQVAGDAHHLLTWAVGGARELAWRSSLMCAGAAPTNLPSATPSFA